MKKYLKSNEEYHDKQIIEKMRKYYLKKLESLEKIKNWFNFIKN